MKISLLALVLAAITGSAFAAPVANLKVNGAITPPTCVVNGDKEVIDVLYTFDVSPDMFPPSGNLKMEPNTKKIEVACDAATYLSFTASDEREGTALANAWDYFGLGNYGGNKVGYFTIVMINAKVKQSPEGKETSVGVSNGFNYSSIMTLNKTQTFSWATSYNKMSPGQIFSADFAVQPTLNSVMKKSDGTAKLDGHAVLAFAFGV